MSENCTPYKTEKQLTIRVVDWCKVRDIPVIHYPSEGKRNGITGKILQRMGWRKGVFDLFIYEPMDNGIGYCHGLWLELKMPGGKVSTEQYEFQVDVRKRDYAAEIAVGFDQAVNIIRKYTGIVH